MANPVIRFTGLNNRLRPSDLPVRDGRKDSGRLFKAVNVQFDNDGQVLLPCQNISQVYAGDCHSLFVCDFCTLFVENDNLYKLASPSNVELLADIGATRVSYTQVGDTIYFSNGTVSGRYVRGDSVAKEWGVPTPDAPDVAATLTGGMFAGDYRVAITWIGNWESGAGNSVKVTVAEGGGINLSNFPTAPDYVTHFAVWLTSVNGKILYFYDEYSIATTSVDLVQSIGAIPLETQFAEPPAPEADGVLCYHYGQIYYSDGPYLRYTHVGTKGPNYGLQFPFNFLPIDTTDIQVLISMPNVLYVGTDNAIYRLLNINGDGPPILEQMLDCAAVKGSEAYDPNGSSAYFMSDRGVLLVTGDGIQELTYKDVAMPFYLSGSSTITEIDGIKYFLFFGSGGVDNPLANSEWLSANNTPEGWAVNIETGAVSQYEGFDINNVSGGYVANSTGIHQFTTVYDGIGTIQTAKHNFESSTQKRITDTFTQVDGGKTTLTVTTDNSAVAYNLPATTQTQNIKTNLALGAKGQFWQFTLANKTGEAAKVGTLELVVNPIRRH